MSALKKVRFSNLLDELHMAIDCLPIRSFPFHAICFVLAFVSTHAELSDSEYGVLRKALTQKPMDNYASCAYTQTVYKPQEMGSDVFETVISRFDPRANPASPWTLLSINDRPPTVKELADFNPQDRGHPLATGFSYPNIDELRIVAKEGDIWSLQGPADGMRGLVDEDFNKRLNVTITIHEPTRTLKSLRTSLKKPFRSRLVARFETFDQTLEFEFDRNVQNQVMHAMTMEMEMKLFGKAQSFSLNLRYSDFDCL